MILSTRRTQILMCKEPTDMRLGYNSLQGDVLICKRLSQGLFCRPNPSYKK
jgi:hypothetical protein